MRPQPGHENGSAVIVAPGGAYRGLAAILEGREVADWFAAHGFTAFVLRYRLGQKYLLPIPLTDAHRAVLQVKSREAGGQGHANADVTFSLDDGGGTIHTAAQISGKAASMGEGVVVSVLDALIKNFAENLATA